MARVAVLVGLLALAAVVACGGAYPDCASSEVGEAVVQVSADNLWYTAGVQLVTVSEGREVSRGAEDWVSLSRVIRTVVSTIIRTP